MDEKFILTIDQYEGNHASDYYFFIEAYTTQKHRVKIEKENLIPVNRDTFVIPIDVSVFERGMLIFDIYAEIPDPIFSNGICRKRLKISTNYTVQ